MTGETPARAARLSSSENRSRTSPISASSVAAPHPSPGVREGGEDAGVLVLVEPLSDLALELNPPSPAAFETRSGSGAGDGMDQSSPSCRRRTTIALSGRDSLRSPQKPVGTRWMTSSPYSSQAVVEPWESGLRVGPAPVPVEVGGKRRIAPRNRAMTPFGISPRSTLAFGRRAPLRSQV